MHFAYFVLTDDRAHLYERIDRRVDQMMEEGLVNEVQRFKRQGLYKAACFHAGTWLQRNSGLSGWQIVRWKKLFIQLKRDTRHFAKRQLTWFKRERDVIWINKQSFGYDDGADFRRNAYQNSRGKQKKNNIYNERIRT